MAKAITLSGVEQAAFVPTQHRVCTPVEVFSPTLNQNVTVCRESMPPVLEVPSQTIIAPSMLKKKIGRPKGSKPGKLDKSGKVISKPKFNACTRFIWVNTKKGRRCRCASGNGKYAPNSMCQRGSNNAG